MARAPLIVSSLVAVLVAACGGAAVTATPSASLALSSTPTVSSSVAPSAVPSPSLSPTPLPTAKPSSKPAPWETYTSKRYRYTISYPPFWKVWPPRNGESDLFDHSGYPHIYVSRDVGTGLTLSETVTWDIAWYKSHYHTKVVANKAIKVAGYNGRLITYRGLDGAVRVVIQSLQLVKGRVSYDLSMVGLAIDADSNASIFKRMYTSFKPT